MVWIYLAALEECPLRSENLSDPWHTVKLTHTVKQYSYQEWLTALLPILPSGILTQSPN